MDKRRIVLLLIALAVAYGTAKALLLGTYCLVPSAFLKADESGTAETSIYGVVLYRETGTDHTQMYHQAVWWHEVTLNGIWAAAVVTGTGTYLIAGRFWRRETIPPPS